MEFLDPGASLKAARVFRNIAGHASDHTPLQSPSTRNLQNLLQNPIKFVPATELTFADEKRMAPKFDTEPRSPCRVETQRSSHQKHKPTEPPGNVKDPDNWPLPSPTRQISSKWENKVIRSSTSIGFENRGVQCYRNSVLQALLHMPKFVNWLVVEHRSCNVRGCIACRLRGLCQKYWDEPKDRAGIQRLLSELQACLKASHAFKSCGFQWSRQHDAPEYYNLLVSAMLESNPRIEKTIKALFGHSLAIKMTCPRCLDQTRLTTAQNEDFVLSVKYKKASSLLKLLNVVTFGKSVVQGRRCDRCKHVSDTPRLEQVLVAPDILVIQLHRFAEGRGLFGGIVKDTDPIPYPESLDFTPFTESGTELRYVLLSAIDHLGSRDSGHYKVVSKGPNGGWEDIEDEMVRRTHLNAALEPGRPWTPYVLFYARIETAEAASKSLDVLPEFTHTNGTSHTKQSLTEGSFARQKRQQFGEMNRHSNKRPRGNGVHGHRRWH